MHKFIYIFSTKDDVFIQKYNFVTLAAPQAKNEIFCKVERFSLHFTFSSFFQAFKFPDSMNVHFQCVVQVCRGSCPDPQCGGVISDIPVSSNDNYGAPQAPALDR